VAVSIFNDVMARDAWAVEFSLRRRAAHRPVCPRLMDGDFDECWSSSTATARCQPPTSRKVRTWLVRRPAGLGRR